MDSGRGSNQGRLRKIRIKNQEKNNTATHQENSNRTRREKYNSVEEYRDKVRTRSKEYYRSKNPRTESRLSTARGYPLIGATQTEVYVPFSKGRLKIIEAYSLPATGLALGKVKLTVKRWISIGILPEPIYIGTSRGYKYYSKEEVICLCREVYKHEIKYDYLGINNQMSINSIHQAIEHCRKIGKE